MRKKFFILIVIGVALMTGVNAVSGAHSVIRGRITDINGNPLGGASIRITGTYLGVHSESNGTFSIMNLQDGDYTVKVSFVGYKTFVEEVKLKKEAFLDIILEEEQFITSEVVVKATRAGSRSPLAYSNLDFENLRKMNSGQDLPFLLTMTPSLVETSESGNGIGYTSLRIRGTASSRINVTLDGIPLNNPESQETFWVDLPDLVSSVDNIQIQRGVGTSTNGAGAFGASINIQTTGIDNEPFVEINSSAGSFGTMRNNITAGTGLLGGKFAFRMRYSDLRSDGYIDRTGSEHRSAHISGLYRAGKSTLKANILLGEEHTGIGWWGVPGEMLLSDRKYNPAGEYTDENGIKRYYDNESDNYVQSHYQIIYDLKLRDNLSFHSTLHYTKGQGYYEEFKDDRTLSDYGLPDIEFDGTVISETDLIRRKWMSNDFYGFIWSLNTSKSKLEASIGGGINMYDGDHYGRIIWMRYAGSTEKDFLWYLNNGLKGEISIYSKINYLLSDHISVFGDLQYRYISYSMTGEDDDLKDISQEHRFNFFNPKAGLFFNIAPGHEAYVSLAIAGREPSRADFKEAAGDPDAAPESETLFDIETGYKIRTGKSILGVNVFSMVYDNQLVPTGELSSVGYSIMTNVKRSYRLGIELSGGFIPVDYAGWNFNLTLSRNKIIDFVEHYTDYNTSDWSAEYKSRNLGTVDIAYSPSVIANSDLYFNMRPEISVHFISKYVGKQYFDNTMNDQRKLDPYFVNNIRLDFENIFGKIRESYFQIFVNNIFNAKYESNAYGGNWFENGKEQTWSYYFPQAGINFLLKVGLKF